MHIPAILLNHPLIKSSIIPTYLIRVRVDGRISSIRNLKLAVVVVLILLLLPDSLDSWQGSTAVTAGVAIRNWKWRVLDRVEDIWVRGVEKLVLERRSGRPFSKTITCFGGNLREDVGSYVPSAESV
jgi:hypothetical protein